MLAIEDLDILTGNKWEEGNGRNNLEVDIHSLRNLVEQAVRNSTHKILQAVSNVISYAISHGIFYAFGDLRFYGLLCVCICLIF